MTLDGWTLLTGIVSAGVLGISAYYVPRWWLIPLPLVALFLLERVVTANQDVYERFPEDVQFAVYASLILVAVGVGAGVVAAKLERRRRS